jgi:hypothetical protein
MPIPASPDGEGVASTVLALFRQVHEELRHEINGLGTDALNWVPAPGANAIATIIVHLVGSEAETLRAVAALPCTRDRDAEFREVEATLSQILDLLDEADDLIFIVSPRIGVERLDSTLALPTVPAEEERSGLTWLIGNYGHAREHLGHVQLTRQLYEVQGSIRSRQSSAPS